MAFSTKLLRCHQCVAHSSATPTDRVLMFLRFQSQAQDVKCRASEFASLEPPQCHHILPGWHSQSTAEGVVLPRLSPGVGKSVSWPQPQSRMYRTYIHIYPCTYTHTYIHTCIHTYIHHTNTYIYIICRYRYIYICGSLAFFRTL